MIWEPYERAQVGQEGSLGQTQIDTQGWEFDLVSGQGLDGLSGPDTNDPDVHDMVLQPTSYHCRISQGPRGEVESEPIGDGLPNSPLSTYSGHTERHRQPDAQNKQPDPDQRGTLHVTSH